MKPQILIDAETVKQKYNSEKNHNIHCYISYVTNVYRKSSSTGWYAIFCVDDLLNSKLLIG
jgi:hypothetical protein